MTNAVRVFYKEEDDDQRQHIDIPVYRRFEDRDGNVVRELASQDGWVLSDPTQVNTWFNDRVVDLNNSVEGKGTQFCHLIQLLKRFCRSRDNWDMPSGMKLTMLVAECQPSYNGRIDKAFMSLLDAVSVRLASDKVIRNLAHPDRPELTRTDSDSNVEELADKIEEALVELQMLDESEKHNERAARKAWDWIFKSDGYFRQYDEEKCEARARRKERVGLINSGNAHTNSLGVICATGGSKNSEHKFYGEDY
ncbi:hypothetical protein [Cerasicoccus maritimus]|uniref:hypothetical protein n=1 Tax=Cerasicoccus maritimus TaxID=490089 RepID=UPI002852850B|nr:hypothetical protein [Cerasicoccus maritimus]